MAFLCDVFADVIIVVIRPSYHHLTRLRCLHTSVYDCISRDVYFSLHVNPTMSSMAGIEQRDDSTGLDKYFSLRQYVDPWVISSSVWPSASCLLSLTGSIYPARWRKHKRFIISIFLFRPPPLILYLSITSYLFISLSQSIYHYPYLYIYVSIYQTLNHKSCSHSSFTHYRCENLNLI